MDIGVVTFLHLSNLIDIAETIDQNERFLRVFHSGDPGVYNIRRVRQGSMTFQDPVTVNIRFHLLGNV